EDYSRSAPTREGMYGGPETATPEASSLMYEFGISIPAAGDLLLDADPNVGGSIIGSYHIMDLDDWPFPFRLLPELGLNLMFTGASGVEEEQGAVFGGQGGNYRQETTVYGLTVGPRLAKTYYFDKARGDETHSYLQVFTDAGFGGYLTRIEVDFPRGMDGAHEIDKTSDFGFNFGAGLVLSLTESVYLGGSIRVHWILFRPEEDEPFLGQKGQGIHDGVFADSGGGRSDNLIFLTIGVAMGIKF
ncbi:MAG: hypothetical protein O6952_01255, partial [Planctomycetota bacterium]|nr:hypothetical protein [Planctomycetota bacterium]